VAPSAADPPAVLRQLAEEMVKPGSNRRRTALEATWQLIDTKRNAQGREFNQQLAVSHSLAAALLVCPPPAESLRPAAAAPAAAAVNSRPAAAGLPSSTAWSFLLEQLVRRGQMSLVLQLLTGEEEEVILHGSHEQLDHIGGGGGPNSGRRRRRRQQQRMTPIAGHLEAKEARALYRSMVARGSSNSSSFVCALLVALSFSPSSPLPRLSIHQLVQFLAQPAAVVASAAADGSALSALMEPRLLRALLRHAEISVPALMLLQEATGPETESSRNGSRLLNALLDHACRGWRQQQFTAASGSRPSAGAGVAACSLVGPGSLSHVVSLLVCGQQPHRALLVWLRAQQIDPRQQQQQMGGRESHAILQAVIERARRTARELHAQATEEADAEAVGIAIARYDAALLALQLFV